MKRILPVLLLFFFVFASCGVKESGPLSETEFLLDTVCTIKIYGQTDSSLLDVAFDEIKRLEGLLSTKTEGSEIYRINARAGISAVSVSDETYGLIKDALEFSFRTEGVFNIAVGPLVDLWGIGTENARVPSQQEIDAVLPLLDYTKVIMDDAGKSVYLADKGMSLDLGAIAKGYIADKTAELLRSRGVRSAVLNLGGNVYVIGSKPNGDKWKIGIQDPFGERNDYFAVYQAEDETLVSSGIYERYFIKDGVRYHHIFDCKTGYPVKNDIYSATVIGKDSETADALSTIVFSLGIEKGFAFVTGYPGYDLVFVDAGKDVTVSGELDGKLVISDENFKLSEHE
jgi:FAD:protein FMN transferase